jgi:hypothetical protein
VRFDPRFRLYVQEGQSFRARAGERKQFFGRTARHLVTHMTHSDVPDTLIDGWYVAPGLPQLRASGNAVAVLTETRSVGVSSGLKLEIP